MSNPRIQLRTLGRFGNQMFQYAFARGYAERYGLPLWTDDWIGRRIFDLSEPLLTAPLPQRSELSLKDGEQDIEFYCYAQHQRCLEYYTKSDLKRWFRFRPEIEEVLRSEMPEGERCLAHRRIGDYVGYGYPVVSRNSYLEACEEFGLPSPLFVTEETQRYTPRLPAFLAFLLDFYRLLNAPILLRANSTFSWWAGALGSGEVYSPIIEGLDGGREHDVPFVSGNWPRFTNLDHITDLHLRNE